MLDDIGLLMDDVAAMTKVAGKKTAGILGDDLAVNAEKAVGFSASRELPVLWAITKGSFLNKLIILPVAFALSAWASWLIETHSGCGRIVPVVRRGGKGGSLHPTKPNAPRHQGPSEAERIRSAVTVDFILSVEIVILALGQVLEASLAVQAVVVSIIAVLATVGVYGLVALLVRMDDAGLALMKREGRVVKRLGLLLVSALPWVIKALGAIGTVALLLVSGGIFHHHLPWVHDALHAWPSMLSDMVLGATGSLVVWVQCRQAKPCCAKAIRAMGFPRSLWTKPPIGNRGDSRRESSLLHGKTHQRHSANRHRHSRCPQGLEVVPSRLWH